MDTTLDPLPEELPPPVPQPSVSQDDAGTTVSQNPSPQPEPGQVDADGLTHDAIVFVPGIHDDWADQSLSGLALQIVAAFNRWVPSARFRSELSAGGRLCRIFMRESAHDLGTGAKPDRQILDLYALD